ncbi:MAG: transglutaminase family protein [Patescibacteria group bacterium]
MQTLARIIILPILFFTCYLLLFTFPARAEGEFKTSYKVHYQIENTGQTTVTQTVTLENQTPNFYADKFELKIGSTKINNLKARDESGDLETGVKFENNVTTINIKFNQRVIGQGKTLTFNLSYTTGEIATKSGQIWEISVPKLAKSPDLGAYDVTVALPRGFGPNAFAIPEPLSVTQGAQTQEFIFNRDQLLTSGIAMSFGQKQVFSFSLKYFLENTNLTSQTYSITLPPDNNYQKIVIGKIEPAPIDVVVDDDGNFLAKYKLRPKEKLSILVDGDVEVFSRPFRKINVNLSQAQRETYTQPQRYWETDNAFIKDKAKELKTPEKIYAFVTDFLSYNNDRLNLPKIERKGAVAAYSAPKDSVCMEFTDLFIAIARAAKIPSREVQGYAYTQNERLRPLSLNLYQGDVLHAWPEYWDNEMGWVQIDPTWASTSGGLDYFNKLDFNHITFIQRGTSSTLPYPAGAYKGENQRSEKTVFVQFAQDLPTPTSIAQIEAGGPKRAFASFPFKVKANLINTGSTSIIGKSLEINTINLNNRQDQTVDIPILPPFAHKTYELNFQTDGLFKATNAAVIFAFADVQTTKPIVVEPIYKVLMDPMFIVSILTLIVITLSGLFIYKKVHSSHKHNF